MLYTFFWDFRTLLREKYFPTPNPYIKKLTTLYNHTSVKNLSLISNWVFTDDGRSSSKNRHHYRLFNDHKKRRYVHNYVTTHLCNKMCVNTASFSF